MPSQFSRTTRALVSDTSHYALIAWLVAGVCLACWLAWFTLSGVTVYETSRKARLEVTQAPHPVAALVAGKLTESSLVIGREVRAGDVLAELDSAAVKLRLREEELRRDAYPPKIASLRREIAALEEAMIGEQKSAQAATQSAQARMRESAAAAEFAKDNERRLSEASGIGSVAEIDALRALAETRKLNAAGDALSSEARRLEIDGGTRASQSRAQIESLRRSAVSLEGEMATGQAAISRLRLELERHRIRAPVAGKIGEVMALRPGAYVTEGLQLATVIPAGGLVIVADFNPSSALGRVRAGQPARLRLDGFPWAQYGSVAAKVVRVAGEIRDNALRVELAPLPNSTGALVMQHGLSGTVEVNIERVSPAVMVLRAAGQLVSQQSRTAGDGQSL